MNVGKAWLSRPAVVLPERALDNDQIVAAVRERFVGPAADWPEIETTIRSVFARCNSAVRYVEADAALRVGAFAARAAQACLDQSGVDAGELSRVVYCGVAREDFEPATAMELAAHLGVQTTHAFDVTSACAGQLEGIQIARALLAIGPDDGPALIASGELTRGFLSHDIQGRQDLQHKVAGLTIGNAAAAWLVSGSPLPGGCLELVGGRTFSRPQHWHLCQAPIDGTFSSLSHELFKLHHYVPGEVRRFVADHGWNLADVDHWILHQPSDAIVARVVQELGVAPESAAKVHSLYGNTVSTSVALAMDYTLKTRTIHHGDRFVLVSAAAGFSLVMLAGVWVEA